ncbi:MAG: formylglycine-generating enzyme family protein [Pleurocapsa sp. MO_226.B13]|nr:formylglycine-generating enzyme family protein [Pleurocapsa sp. MO_226.B13]
MKIDYLTILLRFICLSMVIISCLVVMPPVVIASPSCPEGMVFIPGGTFRMGDDRGKYEDEKAVDDITIKDFCIDSHEVTNADYQKFVEATGYVTVAERPLSKEQFPDLPDEQRSPGSLVFIPPAEDVQQVPYLSWWHWVPGANWLHPQGPESSLEGKENYPVVHIAYEDAEAYADWAGKQLPTEAQWEYAARGGLKDRIFAWGNKYSAKKANTWQGRFPFANEKQDGYVGASPVGSFPPNGFGLYDMTGNVWELTSDWYRVERQAMAHSIDPQGFSPAESFDPKKPGEGAMHVIKGGSYLCAKNYCSRYRPAARESQPLDTGTTHIGFRLVKTLTTT